MPKPNQPSDATVAVPLSPEAAKAVDELTLVTPAQLAVVPIPKNAEERKALELERENPLDFPPKKATWKMEPKELAAYYTRRRQIYYALRDIAYDGKTVPTPQTDEERAAIEHELENPLLYPPFKHIETMTREEEAGHAVHKRQLRLALQGLPDDTTPAARESAGRCCG